MYYLLGEKFEAKATVQKISAVSGVEKLLHDFMTHSQRLNILTGRTQYLT